MKVDFKRISLFIGIGAVLMLVASGLLLYLFAFQNLDTPSVDRQMVFLVAGALAFLGCCEMVAAVVLRVIGSKQQSSAEQDKR